MKEGLQYQRTDKAIRNAFVELLEQKKFEQITIADILKEAPVSRNTFYAHYRDKYEIAESFYQEYLEKFHDFKKNTYDNPDAGLYTASDYAGRNSWLIQAYGRFYRENKKLIHILEHIHTDTIDMHKVMLEDQKMLYRNDPFHKDTPKEQLEYETAIYAGILSALMELPQKTSRDTDQFLSQMDSINDAVITAALYAIGIRMPEHQAAALSAVKEIQQATELEQVHLVSKYQK